MGERTTFNFRVDKDFKNKFCEIAKANGTTATDLITQWMQDYMESQSCTDSANTANTGQGDDSKKQDDQKRLNRVIIALEHRVRDLESKSAGKDDLQIQETLVNLQERLELLEENQKSNQDAISSLEVTKLSRSELEGWSHPINFETPNQDDRESERMLQETSEDEVERNHPHEETRTDDITSITSSNDNEGSDQDATETIGVKRASEIAGVKEKTFRAKAKSCSRRGISVIEYNSYKFKIAYQPKNRGDSWKFEQIK